MCATGGVEAYEWPLCAASLPFRATVGMGGSSPHSEIFFVKSFAV